MSDGATGKLELRLDLDRVLDAIELDAVLGLAEGYTLYAREGRATPEVLAAFLPLVPTIREIAAHLAWRDGDWLPYAEALPLVGHLKLSQLVQLVTAIGRLAQTAVPPSSPTDSGAA